MVFCNASGFQYNAFLLRTNIDWDHGSFLEFVNMLLPTPIMEWFTPIIFGLDFFFFSLKKKGKTKKN